MPAVENKPTHILRDKDLGKQFAAVTNSVTYSATKQWPPSKIGSVAAIVVFEVHYNICS